MEATGGAGARSAHAPQKKVYMTDEENQILEAASRTEVLLHYLAVVPNIVRGRMYPPKLGSIAVAALKLLLHVVSYVGGDPATRQLSMQEFRLPHFVPPPPPPAVEPAWPTQTVSAISEIVTCAKGLASHALAAIEATKQVVLDSEFLLLEHEERSEAELLPEGKHGLAPTRRVRRCSNTWAQQQQQQQGCKRENGPLVHS